MPFFRVVMLSEAGLPVWGYEKTFWASEQFLRVNKERLIRGHKITQSPFRLRDVLRAVECDGTIRPLVPHLESVARTSRMLHPWLLVLDYAVRFMLLHDAERLILPNECVAYSLSHRLPPS